MLISNQLLVITNNKGMNNTPVEILLTFSLSEILL